MILVICLDDKNGYSFGGRRQSRDKIQIDKMLKEVGGTRLLLNEYSAKLFDPLPKNITVSTDPINAANDGDFCFIENTDIEIANDRVEKIIVYRWNRAYPSDKKFPDRLLSDRKLMSSVDFVGNSHDKITEEVYV